MSTHHTLDVYPNPKDKAPRFINEPWLIDNTLLEYPIDPADPGKPDGEPDNIRIYLPLDLNKTAILRRLRYLVYSYEEANEENELSFSVDVDQLISQIEIYDQIWFVRHVPKDGQKHSAEAVELVREFVKILEEIPDGCAECFPFVTIDELRAEYLS